MHQRWSDFLAQQTPGLEPKNAPGLVNLSTYGLLQLRGEDATSFLQGYVTCDLDNLSAYQGLFGAMCDIRGRTITSFYLLELNGHPTMILNRSVLNMVSDHLHNYLMFSKSRLIDISDESVLLGKIGMESTGSALEVAQSESQTELSISNAPTRQLCICNLEHAKHLWSIHAPNTFPDASPWLLADMRAGIILVPADLSGEYVPQALNLDTHHAISFSKGCYLGQEIVARLQHRGALKRRMLLYRWETQDSGASPRTGDELYLTKSTEMPRRNAGKVIQCQKTDLKSGLLLAVVGVGVTQDLCIDGVRLTAL